MTVNDGQREGLSSDTQTDETHSALLLGGRLEIPQSSDVPPFNPSAAKIQELLDDDSVDLMTFDTAMDVQISQSRQ